MTKFYLILSICAVIIGMFFWGKSIGVSECKVQNLQNQIDTDKQYETKQRVINETVYKTGMGDIRRILRDKYTIAE